jgi:predicted aminopeptidase
VRLALLLLALGGLSGCYPMQALRGQAQVLARSEPISQVLNDAGTPEQVQQRLRTVEAAREFAESELRLVAGDSYRDYADLGRAYAVWNVVAVPELSLAPRRWCFPVAGCVSYLGYFREERAIAAAHRLARRGYDVTVGGVAAYSTLGQFADPVLNTMMRWSEARLVGTLFHELAHQRLYVAGDSAFNEAFANVVEEQGLRLWFESRGDSAGLREFETRSEREADFAGLVRETSERLAELYASGLTVEQKRIEKQREFGRLKFRYGQLRRKWGGYGGYDEWFARSLNNAHLAAVGTYQDCVPGLRRELAAAGSLTRFYVRAEELAAVPLAERRSRVCGPVEVAPPGAAASGEDRNQPPDAAPR